ncbi:MAG: hypothetical protein HUU22_08705 [Phycisphaerae bacterium]|nr:hypothetical protein [Phycisphaerae bacterium]NUQ46100.1 hypothetical protein [Phycisphaerae bacterium]
MWICTTGEKARAWYGMEGLVAEAILMIEGPSACFGQSPAADAATSLTPVPGAARQSQ